MKYYYLKNFDNVIIGWTNDRIRDDLTGWTEGEPHDLYDNNGMYKYKEANGEIVERTAEDRAADVLAQRKAERIAELENKTKQLINKGLIHNDVKFGTSAEDQINWNSLLLMSDTLTYPCDNVVKDWDGNYYTLQSAQEVKDMVSDGMAQVNAYRASHKTLKDAINAAETLEELAAIIDDRI